MNTPTPTPTPRTDAAWEKTFKDDEDQCRAGNASRDMRDECATIERELAAAKAECKKMKTAIGVGVWHSAELSFELTRLRAEIERWRDSNNRLRAEMESQAQRAEKAEATLEFIAEQGGTIHQTESGEISCNGRWCAEQARDAIDAAMKEENK